MADETPPGNEFDIQKAIGKKQKRPTRKERRRAGKRKSDDTMKTKSENSQNLSELDGLIPADKKGTIPQIENGQSLEDFEKEELTAKLGISLQQFKQTYEYWINFLSKPYAQEVTGDKPIEDPRNAEPKLFGGDDEEEPQASFDPLSTPKPLTSAATSSVVPAEIKVKNEGSMKTSGDPKIDSDVVDSRPSGTGIRKIVPLSLPLPVKKPLDRSSDYNPIQSENIWKITPVTLSGKMDFVELSPWRHLFTFDQTDMKDLFYSVEDVFPGEYPQERFNEYLHLINSFHGMYELEEIEQIASYETIHFNPKSLSPVDLTSLNDNSKLLIPRDFERRQDSTDGGMFRATDGMTIPYIASAERSNYLKHASKLDLHQNVHQALAEMGIPDDVLIDPEEDEDDGETRVVHVEQKVHFSEYSAAESMTTELVELDPSFRDALIDHSLECVNAIRPESSPGQAAVTVSQWQRYPINIHKALLETRAAASEGFNALCTLLGAQDCRIRLQFDHQDTYVRSIFCAILLHWFPFSSLLADGKINFVNNLIGQFNVQEDAGRRIIDGDFDLLATRSRKSQHPSVVATSGRALSYSIHQNMQRNPIRLRNAPSQAQRKIRNRNRPIVFLDGMDPDITDIYNDRHYDFSWQQAVVDNHLTNINRLIMSTIGLLPSRTEDGIMENLQSILSLKACGFGFLQHYQLALRCGDYPYIRPMGAGNARVLTFRVEALVGFYLFGIQGDMGLVRSLHYRDGRDRTGYFTRLAYSYRIFATFNQRHKTFLDEPLDLVVKAFKAAYGRVFVGEAPEYVLLALKHWRDTRKAKPWPAALCPKELENLCDISYTPRMPYVERVPIYIPLQTYFATQFKVGRKLYMYKTPKVKDRNVFDITEEFILTHLNYNFDSTVEGLRLAFLAMASDNPAYDGITHLRVRCVVNIKFEEVPGDVGIVNTVKTPMFKIFSHNHLAKENPRFDVVEMTYPYSTTKRERHDSLVIDAFPAYAPFLCLRATDDGNGSVSYADNDSGVLKTSAPNTYLPTEYTP